MFILRAFPIVLLEVTADNSRLLQECVDKVREITSAYEKQYISEEATYSPVSFLLLIENTNTKNTKTLEGPNE
jgi:hypothetical protein